MTGKLFEIRNTLDDEEYRLAIHVMTRTFGVPVFEVISERLDDPLSFLQISCFHIPIIGHTGGTYRLGGRLGTNEFPGEAYLIPGKAYLTSEQFTNGMKQTSEELKERFDVTVKHDNYMLVHKPSQLAYSMGLEEVFANVARVSTNPADREVHQMMLKIDTNNIIDILETLANNMIIASGADFTPVQLETYRPSDKYPIGRRRRFK